MEKKRATLQMWVSSIVGSRVRISVWQDFLLNKSDEDQNGERLYTIVVESLERNDKHSL